ncbi:MAG: glycosyltransferase family 2 protein, partial [bacterium]
PHGGIPKTRNFALSKAEGELIAFLDADDMWTPEKLEHQVRYLDLHPECDIIFCRYKNFTDIPENEMTERQEKLLGREIDKCLTAACMRRTLFDRVGYFSLTCPYGEDTEWSARLVLAGVDISKRLEEFLYLRRIHGDNITLAHNDSDNNAFYTSLADSIRKKLRRGGRIR